MADLILNIEQGQSVDFTDISLGDITGYSWIFPGGFPSGSTGGNPNVVYNNIGTFDVSLSTTDTYSVLNTITKIGIIKVDPETWEVNFQINSTPSKMGEVIDFENTSLGSPTYTEWTIPPGSGATGLTSGSKTDLNGIKYQNWRQLTGSHSGSPGENFDSYSSLYASSYFNTGSITHPIRIQKIGPEEGYLELYDYSQTIGSGGNIFGIIESLTYGVFPNEYLGATGHDSAGLEYVSTKTVLGPYLPGVAYPGVNDGGSVLVQLNLKDSFLFNWNLSPDYEPAQGLYYPHSNLEAASVFGRAYSAFNIPNGKIRIDSDSLTFAQMTSGNIHGMYDSIIQGKYVTPYADAGQNIIEANPNYIVIRDDYDTPYMWKSQISLFVSPSLGVGSGSGISIASDAIDLLFSHPKGLPTPGYPPVDKPTLSLVTSMDTHFRINPEFFGNTLTYLDTTTFVGGDPTYTTIGKFPTIPAQWTLNQNAQDKSYLTGPKTGIEFIASDQLPMGIRISVKYAGKYAGKDNPVVIDVYFGLYYPAPGFEILSLLNPIPSEIDPKLSPQNEPLLANSMGNDSMWDPINNPTSRPSWIRVENTGYGLGVVGYINAYLDDKNIGLPTGDFNYGGTGDLIARAVPQYVLPGTYSDNSDGTYGTGGTGPYGISLEVLCPTIEWVRIEELYGREKWDKNDKVRIPFEPYTNANKTLLEIPITWNYSYYTDTGQQLPHMNPGSIVNLGSYGCTYLGISSRMEPFSTGVLGMGPTPRNLASGVRFGGELNI